MFFSFLSLHMGGQEEVGTDQDCHFGGTAAYSIRAARKNHRQQKQRQERDGVVELGPMTRLTQKKMNAQLKPCRPQISKIKISKSRSQIRSD